MGMKSSVLYCRRRSWNPLKSWYKNKEKEILNNARPRPRNAGRRKPRERIFKADNTSP